MSDIANLLREAAQHFDGLHVRNKRTTTFYGDLANKLNAAAESLGEPVAWMTEHDKHPTQFEGWSVTEIADEYGYVIRGPGIAYCAWKDKEPWLYLFCEAISKSTQQP